MHALTFTPTIINPRPLSLTTSGCDHSTPLPLPYPPTTHTPTAATDLVQYGPYKPPQEHGFTEDDMAALAQSEHTKQPVEKQVRLVNGMEFAYAPDPTGRRTGYGRWCQWCPVGVQCVSGVQWVSGVQGVDLSHPPRHDHPLISPHLTSPHALTSPVGSTHGAGRAGGSHHAGQGNGRGLGGMRTMGVPCGFFSLIGFNGLSLSPSLLSTPLPTPSLHHLLPTPYLLITSSPLVTPVTPVTLVTLPPPTPTHSPVQTKVQRNITLDLGELDQVLTEVKAAITIAYPMGLPDYDPVQEILDDNEDLAGTAVRWLVGARGSVVKAVVVVVVIPMCVSYVIPPPSLSLSPSLAHSLSLFPHILPYPRPTPTPTTGQAGKDVFEEESTQLWWANRELVATEGKLLGDYIGRNEKTKIVAKLQKVGVQ